MSLFANLGQGDIWALSGISFASAINDILDKNDFTLEELLEEDELIQEVKSKNERLIEFLCLESTIDQLINFIIDIPTDTENELRVYKYPYMSCEVICCENNDILNQFVEQHDGKYLKKLFTVLSSNTKLDNYLSGYFEKILEMLFRRMTVPMMTFLNESGTSLLVDFLNHMDNYSVMQIVQRLMLPHIPFNSQQEKETLPCDDVVENSVCNWSYVNESCVLLLSKLFDESNADVPLHISDLLITVLQLSPPQTLVIKRLCDVDCIDKLLTYSVVDGADSNNVANPITGLASMSLASISVLESLISRLFESSLPFEQNQNIDREMENEHFAFVKVCIDGICEQFVKFIPAINNILRSYLSTNENPCDSLCSQTKIIVPRLGHRGLQLVKLIESVVRLSSAEIDKEMCTSGLFRTCLDLMYFFKSNSLLHLSVQRLLITVIESDRSRSETQMYLMVNCNLMEAVMTTISAYNSKNASIETQKEFEKSEFYATKHSSIMGNAILMAQAMASVLTPEMANGPLDSLNNSLGREYISDESFYEEPKNMSFPSTIPETAGVSDDEGLFFARHEHSNNPDLIGHDGSHHLSEPFRSRSIDRGDNYVHHQSPFSLRNLMSDEDLLFRWDAFVDEKLRPILEDQIGGGNSFPASANVSASFGMNGEAGMGKTGGAFDVDGFNNDFDVDDEDDEDDDDFVANHTISQNYSNRNQDYQEDADVWGDNYESNNPDDDFFVAKDTSSPNGAGVDANSFDFGGFANFDNVEAFNKTTILPSDINNSSGDFAFDAFADFPDTPMDEDNSHSDNDLHDSNKSGELIEKIDLDVFGEETPSMQSEDDPFA